MLTKFIYRYTKKAKTQANESPLSSRTLRTREKKTGRNNIFN